MEDKPSMNNNRGQNDNNHSDNPQNFQPNNGQGTYQRGTVREGKPIGWAILSLFLPIIGLIFFLVWKKTYPKRAKWSGVAALIGFVLYIIIIVSFPIDEILGSPSRISSSKEIEKSISKNIDDEVEVAQYEEPKAITDKRDNSNAKKETLRAGTFDVGKDIQPGRYKITGKGMGNLFVNDGLKINEILDDGSSALSIGVKSVTIDLVEGDVVKIDGIDSTTFSPAKTEISNKLTTGEWKVGEDIKAGSYDATCKKDESGNLFVMEGDIPVVNEILDRGDTGIGVKKVRVKLEDGQTVKVSGMNQVTFQ